MINTFVALDIETTGLNPAEDKIIEIGMAKISDGEIVDSYSTLVNPGIKISERITMITGIIFGGYPAFRAASTGRRRAGAPSSLVYPTCVSLLSPLSNCS